MNELGNTPADKNYKPSGIVNDLDEGQIKAVQLEDGRFVTQSLYYQHKMQVLEMFLSWEDVKEIVRIADTMMDFDPNDRPEWMESYKAYYAEVLKRFKEAKK